MLFWDRRTQQQLASFDDMHMDDVTQVGLDGSVSESTSSLDVQQLFVSCCSHVLVMRIPLRYLTPTAELVVGD